MIPMQTELHKQTSAKNSKFTEIDWNFQTFNHEGLQEMLTEAKSFWNELCTQSAKDPFDALPGRWLSMCGISDIGKSYLAKTIFENAKKILSHGKRPLFFGSSHAVSKPRNFEWVFMPEFSRKLKRREIGTKEMNRIKRAWLCVVDDLGAETDSWNNCVEAILEIFEARQGKWTIITSNKLLADISKDIDHRIASRMIRGDWGSKVTQINTCEEYSMRK